MNLQKNPLHKKPCCGFCLKECLTAKNIQLHIANTAKCRAARNQLMNRRSASPLRDIFSTTNTPGLEPRAGDIMDGFVGHDEIDYISSERLMDIDVAQQSPSHDSHPSHIELDNNNNNIIERYAEDYNPSHVAHLLQKSQTAFELMRDEELGETPWTPFKDEDEWELTQFLIKEVPQTTADKFLKLQIVSVGSLSDS